MLEEFENHLAKEEKRRDDADERLQRASRTLVQVKAGVEHLADKLHHLKAVSAKVFLCKYRYIFNSSMVSESEFNSEDPPGFDPLAGQGERVFLSLRVNSHADFCVPPPSCVQHATKFVRSLKISYPSVVKE